MHQLVGGSVGHMLRCLPPTPRHMQPRDPKKDPQTSEAKNLMRRKRIQLEHMREYDEAVVTLKQKVGMLAFTLRMSVCTLSECGR